MKQLIPFDLKFWKGMFFYDFITNSVHMHCKNRILKILLLCPCCVFEIVISFFFVCVVTALSVVYVFFAYCYGYHCYIIFIACFLKDLFIDFHNARLFRLCLITACFGVSVGIGFSCFVMALVIQSLVLGLFLNLTYFIPYVAFFAVLLFNCGSYWKSMEGKYLVLKRLIYEECRLVQNVNNGCIPNRQPKENEKVLPVVSKVLYDKIREELLPYHKNLFYFGLKIFLALVLSFSIFKLINLLHEFNVTGTVQVVTTASLGVIPHIFNMVALKTNEEKKKALEEKLKLNVKYKVEGLVRRDPELARTVLILQENNNTVADKNVQNGSNNHQENSHDCELLETTSDGDNNSDQVE